LSFPPDERLGGGQKLGLCIVSTHTLLPENGRNKERVPTLPLTALSGEQDNIRILSPYCKSGFEIYLTGSRQRLVRFA